MAFLEPASEARCPSVLTTTNLRIPMNDWTVVGTATQVGNGLYEFTDAQATNAPQQSFRVRWP